MRSAVGWMRTRRHIGSRPGCASGAGASFPAQRRVAVSGFGIDLCPHSSSRWIGFLFFVGEGGARLSGVFAALRTSRMKPPVLRAVFVACFGSASVSKTRALPVCGSRCCLGWCKARSVAASRPASDRAVGIGALLHQVLVQPPVAVGSRRHLRPKVGRRARQADAPFIRQ